MPALQKQPVAVNFAKGIDTKSDPFQIPIGNYFSLVNSVFTKQGLLSKRNGFDLLPAFPVTVDYLSTFNENLLGIGTNKFYALSLENTDWVDPQPMPQVNLSTSSVFRNIFSQLQADSAVSPNDLLCTVAVEDTNPSLPGSQTNQLYYLITDLNTGQQVVGTTGITTTYNGTTSIVAARVFTLGAYFIIVYLTGAGNSIEYIAVNYTTLVANAPVQLAASSTSTVSIFDGTVFGNKLYLAYSDATAGIDVVTLDTSLTIGGPTSVDASHTGIYFSVVSDPTSGGIIWISFVDSSDHRVYSIAVDPTLAPILPATAVTNSVGTPLGFGLPTLTSYSTAGTLTVYATQLNTYSFDTSLPTYNIYRNTVTSGGTVGIQSTFFFSAEVASKAFQVNGVNYLLTMYVSNDQPTLFLVADLGGKSDVVSRFAYEVAGQSRVGNASTTVTYLNTIPSATVVSGVAYVSYLVASEVDPIADTNPLSFIYVNGINQIEFAFNSLLYSSANIGRNLNISGGFLWEYDGAFPAENNFFLFPDYVTAGSPTTGTLTAQSYFYTALYTTIDDQGNPINSGASETLEIDVASPQANVINIPTLRITYKNNIRIELYRSSTAQPVPYLLTSIISNGGDFVTYTDNQSDADILGGKIIYTEGGVLENSGAPATNAMAIFDNRLFMIDAEDPNTLWYSKEVVENVSAEMSTLQTVFVAPSSASQGEVGPLTALFPMDEKMILFKKNTAFYFTGSGPDNTGANSGYSQPIQIATPVGCISQGSIVVIDQGLIFQSDKGIWLLGRNLMPQYIGAPVENFTEFQNGMQPLVVSATAIPDTTQLRFMLNTGVTLMYDYFFRQWSIFEGITLQYSTIYQGLHTAIDQSGNILQETPGIYQDISTPVDMSFQTGWINVAGLQGYERFYYFYLLGTNYSNYSLTADISYDYGIGIIPNQTVTIPIAPFPIQQNRVFPQFEKCEAFQLTVQENSTTSGQGLSLSGLNMVVGIKKGYPVRRQSLSVGTGNQ